MTHDKDTFLLGGEVRIHRLGFGAMRLTGQPRNFGPYPDWEGGKKVLRRAVELGVDFIDTALAYGPGHNEQLVAEALHPYPSHLVIATKGGYDKLSADRVVRDARPATLKMQVENALKRLKTERIDLFQLHWVDPDAPIEESAAALEALRLAGLIRFIGLCNVTADELARAQTVARIASVQNRLNQAESTADELVETTARQGLAYIAYGPLGADPAKQGAPLAAAGRPVPSGTPAQAALRWLLDRAPNVVAIPGTTSIPHLEENIGA